MINKKNYREILSKFIEACKIKYEFKEGYIDDVDDNNIYVVFSDSDLYPYEKGDYLSIEIKTDSLNILFTFEANEEFNTAYFNELFKEWHKQYDK